MVNTLLEWEAPPAEAEATAEAEEVQESAAADVNIVNHEGNTALMYAVEFDFINIVRLLLHKEVNVDIENDEGHTALMLAVLRGQNFMVKELLKQRARSERGEIYITALANVNLQNKEGRTALMLAAQAGDHVVVDTLLKSWADVKMQDNDGMTALMYAARNGDILMVNLLLPLYGASALLVNKKNKTAKDLRNNGQVNQRLNNYIQNLPNNDDSDDSVSYEP